MLPTHWVTSLGLSKTVILLDTRSDASLADGRGSGHRLPGLKEGGLRPQAGSARAAPNTPRPSSAFLPRLCPSLSTCGPHPNSAQRVTPGCDRDTRLPLPALPSGLPVPRQQITEAAAWRRSFEAAFCAVSAPGSAGPPLPCSPGTFKRLGRRALFRTPQRSAAIAGKGLEPPLRGFGSSPRK